ncbi:hypothetical protein FLLO111716_01355 [Flavobacterium longum]
MAQNPMCKILVLLLLSSLTWAQNMVNNPSFEQYSSCPTTQGTLQALNWTVTPNSSLSSPDYFNTCANPGNNSQCIPINICGNQTAYEGNAYAGIFCYGSNSDQREYIQTQLSTPMVQSHVYTVSFWVSPADKHRFAVATLGARITVNQVSGNGGYLITETPQIQSNSLISNYDTWTKIQGTYTAAGGEKFLTIGNFFNDANSGAVEANFNGLFSWGYYYVDMVSVTDNSLGTPENVFADAVSIYPNPVRHFAQLQVDGNFAIAHVALFDIHGKALRTHFNSLTNTLDFSEVSAGVYQVVLTNAEGTKISKRIIKI